VQQINSVVVLSNSYSGEDHQINHEWQLHSW